MLELPEVSVFTKFGSGVSPDPVLVSTGQLLATLPGGLGNWLPKPAGLPTGPRVPFPFLPCIVHIPWPSPHCVFPQLRTLLRIVRSPIYPTSPHGISLCLSYLSPSPHCAITLIPLSLWPLLLSHIVRTTFPDLSPVWCKLSRMARHVIPSLFGLVCVCTSGNPACVPRHCDLNFWFWHYSKFCFGLLLKITFWLLPFCSHLLPLRH